MLYNDSSNNSKMYAQQIEVFLNQFEDMLFEDHLQRLQILKNTLEDLEDKELIYSKYGFHYKLCPWSDDDATEGPDTCQCHKLPILKQEALDLMLKYYKLNKRLYRAPTLNKLN